MLFKFVFLLCLSNIATVFATGKTLHICMGASETVRCNASEKVIITKGDVQIGGNRCGVRGIVRILRDVTTLLEDRCHCRTSCNISVPRTMNPSTNAVVAHIFITFDCINEDEECKQTSTSPETTLTMVKSTAAVMSTQTTLNSEQTTSSMMPLSPTSLLTTLVSTMIRSTAIATSTLETMSPSATTEAEAMSTAKTTVASPVTMTSTFTVTPALLTSMSNPSTTSVITNITETLTTEVANTKVQDVTNTTEIVFTRTTNSTKNLIVGRMTTKHNIWIPIVLTLIIVIVLVLIATLFLYKRKQKYGKISFSPLVNFSAYRNKHVVGTKYNETRVNVQAGNTVSSQNEFVYQKFDKNEKVTVNNVLYSKFKRFETSNKETVKIDFHIAEDNEESKSRLYTKVVKKNRSGPKSFENPLYMLDE